MTHHLDFTRISDATENVPLALVQKECLPEEEAPARDDLTTVIKTSKSSSRIRDAWPRGKFVDVLLTHISGVPRTGQKAWRTQPVEYLASSMLALIVGSTLAVWAVNGPILAWPTLLPAWFLMLHGHRNLSLTCMHEAGHNAFFWQWKFANDLLGTAIGVISFVQPYRAFKLEHNDGHHPHLMTPKDPVVCFQQIDIGLRAGMPVASQRQLIWSRLISPLFHLKLFWLRAKTYYSSGTLGHVVFSLCYIFAIAMCGWSFGFHTVWWAWLFPLTIPLNCILVVKDLCEHVYAPPGLKGKSRILACTHQVRCGEPAPKKWFKRILCWWPKMLLIYWPQRELIYPGETIVHDWHHRHAKHSGWSSGIFSRQAEVDRLEADESNNQYTHIWGGPPAAMQATFLSLSKASPAEFEELFAKSE